MRIILKLWLFLAVWIICSGWVLSFFHLLNAPGYTLSLGLFALLVYYFLGFERAELWTGLKFKKFRNRFRRTAPKLYLLLALAAILGGALYHPTHFDGFSYRIPRVFHWLSEQKWHWIRSSDVRLNVVALDFDWLSAPFMAYAHTERSIFLINALSFILLPGAVFTAFHRLGVRKKVAWWWMWIVPAGYCYSMQAGSIGTDAFAAIFSLSAVALALRATEKENARDWWASLFAVALLTGAKQSNLPLALPWVIAAYPGLRFAFKRPAISLAGMALATG
ncbi:MAG: phospholipid carrier-dependent glycosyltransferase, partial [Verrucomicrobiota bacterium]